MRASSVDGSSGVSALAASSRSVWSSVPVDVAPANGSSSPLTGVSGLEVGGEHGGEASGPEEGCGCVCNAAGPTWGCHQGCGGGHVSLFGCGPGASARAFATLAFRSPSLRTALSRLSKSGCWMLDVGCQPVNGWGVPCALLTSVAVPTVLFDGCCAKLGGGSVRPQPVQ